MPVAKDVRPNIETDPAHHFSLFLQNGQASDLQKIRDLAAYRSSSYLQNIIVACEQALQRAQPRKIDSPPAIGLGIGSVAGTVASAVLGWNRIYSWIGMSLLGASAGYAYKQQQQDYTERLNKAELFCKELRLKLGEVRRKELMPESKPEPEAMVLPRPKRRGVVFCMVYEEECNPGAAREETSRAEPGLR